MHTVIKFLKRILTTESEWERQRRMEEEFLADATDLVDLERRQRQLQRNDNLKGWV